MEQVIERDKIFKEVDMLNRVDQFHLLSHLAKTLAKSEEKKYRITNFKGLGKGIWIKDGIDNFVSKERKTWD